MQKDFILSHVDHTMLKQGATWADIQRICDEGLSHKTASVCIPPSYVADAAAYLKGQLAVCTVIGFPNGYNTAAAKVFETAEAVKDGADEVDMVINMGWVKDREYARITQEIRSVKEAAGSRILKVIIETCFLEEEEKIRMCQAVTEAGADFIKTSTGFGSGGATFEDVALFARHVGEGVQIKAAGGISSIADAEEFLRLGASRLGTSRIVKIAKKEGLRE